MQSIDAAPVTPSTPDPGHEPFGARAAEAVRGGAPGSGRLHGLDALRGFALLAGVALHATLSYLPDAGSWWIVGDDESSQALSGLFFVVHMFRMTVFFVLAGFFGRLLCERLGIRVFARDRLRRILVPLLTAWTPIFMCVVAVIVWAAYIRLGGVLPQESPPGPAFTPDDFPLTHLWFLYVLLILYAAMLSLRALAGRLLQGRIGRLVDAGVRVLLRPGAIAVLALPVALALNAESTWIPWFGVPTPDHSLYPNLAALVAYGIAFGFGWLLQRQASILSTLVARWPLHLALALAATLCSILTLGLAPDFAPAAGDAESLRFALVYAFGTWSWTLALIGMALRFLSSPSPVRRYLADASYWIYLVHVPLVMALQVVASLLQWPWWIEYPLALLVAMTLLLASYELCVRHSFIGAWLNGRRMPRVAPVARADLLPA